jgi:hypothetical protein
LEYANIPREKTVSGIDIYHPQYLEFPKNIFKTSTGRRYYCAVNQVIKKKTAGFNPDVIHAHMCYPDGYSAFKLSKKLQIPYIITVRGTDLLTMKRFKQVKRIMIEILLNASKVIFPSYRIANQFTYICPINKYEVIPNGIEIDEFEDLNFPFSKIVGEKVIIVSVSTLYKDKGIDINIHAIRALVNIHKDLHYIVVGDGEERQNLENLVDELQLRDYVTFVGKVDHKKALEYIKFCDIFSLPSWNETFGIVYLEAMYLKKPIVGTFEDGIDGSAKDKVHGFFAHRQNVSEVKDALHKLVVSPALRFQMGLNGYNEVIQNYTWLKHAEKMSRVYEEVKNEYEGI